MNKSKLSLILRIVISFSLLALLFWLARKNFSKIWELLLSVNIPLFLLAVLLFQISNFFMTWRFKIVLSAQNSFFSLRDLFFLTLIGFFFSNFMPTSVGGDLVKGYLLSRKTNCKVSSYTAVIADRIVGMFSLVCIASIALFVMRKNIEHSFVFLTIGLMLLACIAFVLLLANRDLLKKVGKHFGLLKLAQTFNLDTLVKKAYDSVIAYKNHKKKILQMFLLSAIAQLIIFFSVYCLSESLSAHIPFAKILLVMPIISALCMLPVTMNGLGLREWGFVLFFSVNIGKAAALSLSLLFLSMYLLTSVIGGIIYLFWR